MLAYHISAEMSSADFCYLWASISQMAFWFISEQKSPTVSEIVSDTRNQLSVGAV